jgi:hypothetical protein
MDRQRAANRIERYDAGTERGGERAARLSVLALWVLVLVSTLALGAMLLEMVGGRQ